MGFDSRIVTIAAAVGARAIFKFAYSQNTGGLQDGLDKVGKK